jgi:hypothetical protein
MMRSRGTMDYMHLMHASRVYVDDRRVDKGNRFRRV